MTKSAFLQTSCRSSRWLGGLGAVLSCSSMVVAAVAGVAGAAISGTAKGNSMAGMATMSSSSSTSAWVNAINTVGQPLLMVSLLLMIVGLLPQGKIPATLAIIGSVLLYSFMFVQYDRLLPVFAAAVLIAAYGIVFWPRQPPLFPARAR